MEGIYENRTEQNTNAMVKGGTRMTFPEVPGRQPIITLVMKSCMNSYVIKVHRVRSPDPFRSTLLQAARRS